MINYPTKYKIINMKFYNRHMNAIYGVAFVAIVSSALSSCGNNHAKEMTADSTNENVYETFSLKKEQVSSELKLPGELEGYYETGIMAKVNGYIKSMRVDIGDRVNAGQLLAELEAPELISQLTSAYAEYLSKEAMFLNTKGKFVRLKQTNETAGAVSPYDMDLTRTSYTSDSLGYLAAKSKYDAVRQLADYLKITAPFDGIITERALAPGAFVGPNDKQGLPLFKLKKETKLRLHVAVPEKYLAEVRQGELVKFQVKSFPNENFEGRITRQSKNLNIQTRSEIIEIEIDNQKVRLLPGMYAIATIPIQRQGLSFVVPKSAIVTNMEKQFVIRIKNGNEVEYVNVKKGEELENTIEIFGNLNEQDIILVTGSDEIKPGTKLKTTIAAKN
jgi:RND family efflux transporter MFP subunit